MSSPPDNTSSSHGVASIRAVVIVAPCIFSRNASHVVSATSVSFRALSGPLRDFPKWRRLHLRLLGARNPPCTTGKLCMAHAGFAVRIHVHAFAIPQVYTAHSKRVQVRSVNLSFDFEVFMKDRGLQ